LPAFQYSDLKITIRR